MNGNLEQERALTRLLEQAADGVPGAAGAFFQSLLRATVYVPLKPGADTPSGVAAIGAGSGHVAARGFALVEYQGSQTLPIFTEEAFAADWSEADVSVVEERFEKLLWLVGDDVWLYVNPAQEVGKEITPWEIEQLKRGEEGVPDLVDALREDFDDDLIVRSEDDLFPELKIKLRPILELYPELVEAFLVTIKEGESGEEKPTLGVKYERITEAKRVYIRSEIENASAQHLPGHQQLFLIDDLESSASPNWRIFSDSTPFYFAQRKLAPQKQSLPQRLLGVLRSLFRRSGREDTASPKSPDESRGS